MKNKLKDEILSWLLNQPLKPQKLDTPIDQQYYKESYFSVIAGIRADFKNIKINLSRYPQYFTSMQYAESQTFSLNQLFSSSDTRMQKIQCIRDILKNISLESPHPAGSGYAPYILIVEDEKEGDYEDDLEEEFYHTESYPCGLSGTTEKIFEKIYIGIAHDSTRHELIAFGSENFIVVSIDHSDLDAIEAIGLKDEFISARFGCVTYMKKRSEASSHLNHGTLTIKSQGSKDKTWMLEEPFME